MGTRKVAAKNQYHRFYNTRRNPPVSLFRCPTRITPTVHTGVLSKNCPQLGHNARWSPPSMLSPSLFLSPSHLTHCPPWQPCWHLSADGRRGRQTPHLLPDDNAAFPHPFRYIVVVYSKPLEEELILLRRVRPLSPLSSTRQPPSVY